MIKPLYENDAPKDVQTEYIKLKTALNVPTLPLFFSYIGPFPEYLSYITTQLVDNLQNPQFIYLSQSMSEQFSDLIRPTLQYSEEVINWQKLYSNSPEYYHFQQNNRSVYLTNIKLAFIFVALREAVKGWAVAAKKLPSSQSSTFTNSSATAIKMDSFVFDEVLNNSTESAYQLERYQENAPISSNSLIKTGPRSIEKNLLGEYLGLCRNDFTAHMKTEEFWILRLGIEELILSSLDSLPSLIFSPINVVLNLTSRYPQFPELLYLLSEHFPTYAVQRTIFSGYMKD